MHRIPLLLATCAAALLAGCDSASSEELAPGGGSVVAQVDIGVIGTWYGVPGTNSASDTVRIDADSLVYIGGFSLGPTKFGSWFYATAGTGAAAGRMGITNGQTTTVNVTYEYLVSGDTLWMEFQNLAVADPDGRLDRSKSEAFLKAK